MAFRRDGQHTARNHGPKFSPPASGGAIELLTKLLTETEDTNRILRRIDNGITALVKTSVDPYADIFGDSSKSAKAELAELDAKFGLAFDNLTDAEAAALATRLPENLRDAFERSGKYAVKLWMMRLMAEKRFRAKAH